MFSPTNALTTLEMNDIGVDNKQQHYIIIIIIIIIIKKINVAIRAKYFIFCRRNKIGFILFCLVFFFFFHFWLIENSLLK